MLEGEINSFKSIRVSKRRKNMPSYWLIPTKGFLSSLAYTRISSSMGRLMTVPDMRVAPLLPALGRGLTMTCQLKIVNIFQGREMEMALLYRQELLPKTLA